MWNIQNNFKKEEKSIVAITVPEFKTTTVKTAWQ